MKLEDSLRGKKAMENFTKGYNCAQSVFLAFEDVVPMNHDEAAMLSSSFGGGMGRLREVCGAVTGMFMVAGCLYGYSNPLADQEKKEHYERIQELAHAFKKSQGSYLCRELLGLDGEDNPIPSKRTKAYYEERPCERFVGEAAAMMEEYMKNHQR